MPDLVAALRAAELFAALPAAELERLAELAEQVILAPGERLIEEGTPGDACFVVASGQLAVTKRSGATEIPLAVIGPGAITGEMAALEGGTRGASVTARSDAVLVRIPSDALADAFARPESVQPILRTVMGRLRATEAALRERDKLAALGTLSAGLAHELNNPAAAIRRAVVQLDAALARFIAIPPPQPIPSAPEASGAPASTLDRGDAMEAVRGLTGDAEGAAALVDAGWTAGALRHLEAPTVRWLAADALVRQLLAEVRIAADRMGELVSAVKGYVHLDRAQVGEVDVRAELDATLVILRHRLGHGVEVRRRYAEVPRIEAFGGELNQVWTNLIDNAVDAMDGSGVLELRTEPHEDGVAVHICDTGSGIPAGVRDHLFEPFFTTKPPGKGTGLGLHLSHQVVGRHGGRIEVDSAPGRTCFTVILQARPPAGAEDQPASG